MSGKRVRIIASVLHVHRDRMHEIIQRLSCNEIFFEPCRMVRKAEHKRFGLPGLVLKQEEWPGELYFITVPQDSAETVISEISHAAGLDVPGHGSIVTQELVSVHSDQKAPESADGALITCILSLPGAADQLSKAALDFGIGVPVVTLGAGTGVRDYMGLLRITIPPEKEIVHLIIPRHDLESVLHLLIEQGYIDRPSGGFIYAAPVTSMKVDTRMIIGKQRRPVQVEQIIAAIDEIRGSTDWRKRSYDPQHGHLRLAIELREIVVYCREGQSERVVASAMKAGAQGATVSKVEGISTLGEQLETAAWERIVSLVPRKACPSVVEALQDHGRNYTRDIHSIEIAEVLAAYSYTSRSKRAIG